MCVCLWGGGVAISFIPFTDWAHNAHSLTVQRGQNVHYYAQSVKGITVSDTLMMYFDHLPNLELDCI